MATRPSKIMLRLRIVDGGVSYDAALEGTVVDEDERRARAIGPEDVTRLLSVLSISASLLGYAHCFELEGGSPAGEMPNREKMTIEKVQSCMEEITLVFFDFYYTFLGGLRVRRSQGI